MDYKNQERGQHALGCKKIRVLDKIRIEFPRGSVSIQHFSKASNLIFGPPQFRVEG
jgi:hypothetical protein